MRTINIPDDDGSHVEDVWIKVRGKCGHDWEMRITEGLFEGWDICQRCLTPKYDYKYTSVLVKYPYLNRG